MFEVLQQSVRMAHLDTSMDDACQMVTRYPADIMGTPRRGRIEIAADTRMLAFETTTLNELLARPVKNANDSASTRQTLPVLHLMTTYSRMTIEQNKQLSRIGDQTAKLDML